MTQILIEWMVTDDIKSENNNDSDDVDSVNDNNDSDDIASVNDSSDVNSVNNDDSDNVDSVIMMMTQMMLTDDVLLLWFNCEA